MREILFRGKRIDNGKWIYGGYFYEDGKHMIQTDSFYSDVIPSSVGQYTGLKDKNGVKIFEHDIVRDIEKHKLYLVEYQYNTFVLADGNFYMWAYNSEYYEVIGNIFDNPELLKQ